MPHTDFLINGHRVPIETALRTALDDWGRDQTHTYPLLKAMVQREQNESYTPSKFYGCDRSLYLRINRDYAVDPSTAFARLRGSLFHQILEGAAQGRDDYHPLIEVNFTRPIRVDGVWRLVTGRIDLADPARGLLTDYKTTKRLFPPYPKPDDVGKLKLYAWMAQAHGLTLDKGELVYVEIATGRIERARVLIKPASEAWIEQRVRAIATLYDGTIPEIIDLEDQWMCGYCDVAPECITLAAEQNTPPPITDPKARKKALAARQEYTA
ncbi:MAG: PD-(D/E)XK nuclease family protein [Chloroflexi bacterium]|nr:PD-(D/E)XK nuclease family protein [Chloroflexota bacterium]